MIQKNSGIKIDTQKITYILFTITRGSNRFLTSCIASCEIFNCNASRLLMLLSDISLFFDISELYALKIFSSESNRFFFGPSCDFQSEHCKFKKSSEHSNEKIFYNTAQMIDT